jgi:DNA-binding NarL/FixJ family response regulator
MPPSTAQAAQLKIFIVDDHASVLGGTVSTLKQQYSDAEILTAQTAQATLQHLESHAIHLLVVDLSIPEATGEPARTETGIQLLKTLMKRYPSLNIVVQSANARSLIRLKSVISDHEGGFTVADKSFTVEEMLVKVDWALRGVVYTPKEIRNGLDVKSEWLEMLQLAFQEGLQDRAISERLKVSERTVRHYWTKIQDVLDVYPDTGKNIRIHTEMRAREEGLID